jgi:ABC-type amino acid transport substrate-binding protein
VLLDRQGSLFEDLWSEDRIQAGAASVWMMRVTVTTDRHNPPYSDDAGGELRGTTIDLVQRAFATQSAEVVFDPVDGPMAQAVHLAAGRADAADFSITERRRQWYHFSYHYGSEALQVFTLRDGSLWPGLDHFHGVLGAKTDSYAQEFLIRERWATPLFLADTIEQLLEALQQKRVPAVVLPQPTVTALMEADTSLDIVPRGPAFAPTLLALAALPEQQEILDCFNAGLAAIGILPSQR